MQLTKYQVCKTSPRLKCLPNNLYLGDDFNGANMMSQHNYIINLAVSDIYDKTE